MYTNPFDYKVSFKREATSIKMPSRIEHKSRDVYAAYIQRIPSLYMLYSRSFYFAQPSSLWFLLDWLYAYSSRNRRIKHVSAYRFCYIHTRKRLMSLPFQQCFIMIRLRIMFTYLPGITFFHYIANTTTNDMKICSSFHRNAVCTMKVIIFYERNRI